MATPSLGADELLQLTRGAAIGRRTLSLIIQNSKVEGSDSWRGLEGRINNTPQQGINWIGSPPNCRGVIIKAAKGAYKHDGWTDTLRTHYRYSFKARNEVISYTELANRVLVEQPAYRYPLLLFTEQGSDWEFEGRFQVAEIQDAYVIAERQQDLLPAEDLRASEESYTSYEAEGGRRYVSHLLVERNRKVVRDLKTSRSDICELCRTSSLERYGVACVEAHHKVPISTYATAQRVSAEDFALLCPSCHRVVHILMRRFALTYPQIADRLNKLWSKN